jgi:hypothetical protein
MYLARFKELFASVQKRQRQSWVFGLREVFVRALLR